MSGDDRFLAAGDGLATRWSQCGMRVPQGENGNYLTTLEFPEVSVTSIGPGPGPSPLRRDGLTVEEVSGT